MSLSSDPWAFLGLDRAAATGRDVKRAYARLLKLHRPDQDPEGFQRVSSAYQQALSDLAAAGTESVTSGLPETGPLSLPKTNEDNGGEKSPPGLSSPSAGSEIPEKANAAASVPPVPRRLEDFPDLPEPFLTAFENLKQRLQREAHLPEVPEFNVLRNLVREDPALAAPWSVMLEALFSTERGLHLLPQIHPQDVLMMMRRGESSCAARILLSWRDDNVLINRLTQLANLMLDRKIGNDPEMLGALHFTAKLAAFHLPHASARLANEIYRQTSPGVREQIVREIEVRSAAGKMFSILPLPHRRFWEQQLFESGGGATDWSSPENAAALKTVILNCGQNWEGWPLIAQLIPREVLDDSLRRARLAQAEANTRDARHYVRANPGQAFLYRLSRWREWIPSGRWIFVALWLVVHLISTVSKTGSGSSSRTPLSSAPKIPSSSLYNSKSLPAPSGGRSQDMQDALDRALNTLPDRKRGTKGIIVPTDTQTIGTPTLDYQPSQSGSSVGERGYRIGG